MGLTLAGFLLSILMVLVSSVLHLLSLPENAAGSILNLSSGLQKLRAV